jgi:hypothetical protein
VARQVAFTRRGDARRALGRVVPSRQTQTIDHPLMHLLRRLRPHFEAIRAVRFAHLE